MKASTKRQRCSACPAPQLLASCTSHFITPINFFSSISTIRTLYYLIFAQILSKLFIPNACARPHTMKFISTIKARSLAALTSSQLLIATTFLHPFDRILTFGFRTPLQILITFYSNIIFESFILHINFLTPTICNVFISEFPIAPVMHAGYPHHFTIFYLLCKIVVKTILTIFWVVVFTFCQSKHIF